jgi:hypothetical protein
MQLRLIQMCLYKYGTLCCSLDICCSLYLTFAFWILDVHHHLDLNPIQHIRIKAMSEITRLWWCCDTIESFAYAEKILKNGLPKVLFRNQDLGLWDDIHTYIHNTQYTFLVFTIYIENRDGGAVSFTKTSGQCENNESQCILDDMHGGINYVFTCMEKLCNVKQWSIPEQEQNPSPQLRRASKNWKVSSRNVVAMRKIYPCEFCTTIEPEVAHILGRNKIYRDYYALFDCCDGVSFLRPRKTFSRKLELSLSQMPFDSSINILKN